MALLVREKPPLRLSVNITPDASLPARWCKDEPDPQNAPSGLTFSSTMPGGFEQLNATLARDPSVDYPDLEEFATLTVRGVGGLVAWQGRLETSPRTSGDQINISPGAVGWQAALDDDGAAQMIYVDRDLSKWGPPSPQRQANLISSSLNVSTPQTAADPSTSVPSVILSVDGAWASPIKPLCESWYDAGPNNLIHSIYYTAQDPNAGDANWFNEVFLCIDSVASTTETTGNISSVGGTSAYFAPATPYRFALLERFYNVTPSGVQGATYSGYFRNLTVYGTHGLTGRGSDPVGFYASDIVGHAVSTWAPQLALVDTGGASTITPSTFVIPQASYPTPTTAGAIITDITKYELQDWAVWEGPTFWWYPRNALGRAWRARVGPSGLSETGPQVDRIYNGVIVNYTDVTGASQTAGPVLDSDPQNPATLAGLTRYFNMPSIGLSTSAAATQVGQAFLVEQNAVSTAGQASITGYVQDSNGITWPSWMIRAGDNITFVDAHDPVPRRIVKTSYSDDTKVNQLDLDSPPEGLQALLARLSIETTNL